MIKNILITGAAKRIGATCARFLHANGGKILIHYQNSKTEAEALCSELNSSRPDSAKLIQGDISIMGDLENIAQLAKTSWDGLDVLVNNASAFYPTPFCEVNQRQWDELLGSNLKAPFFLTKMLTDTLSCRSGCVINMVDIHAERGLHDHSVYCIAKAGLVAMTQILAKELSPKIRVNAIAPGAILWPEGEISDQQQNEILNRIPLQRIGSPDDIAKAMLYLIRDAEYSTGQVITIDGGRTLHY